MGATLQVSNKPRQGSGFWFDLDLPCRVMLIPKAELRSTRVIGIKRPRQKVLIADNRPDNRAILKEMLQPLGFKVYEATDDGACLYFERL